MAFCFTIELILNSDTKINLFFCPLTTAVLDQETTSLVSSWLPADETQKVNRYIQQSAREKGLMVRGYLRALLSRFADIKPNEWVFEYGEKGKPRLTDLQFQQTGLGFNISHSGDWLLVAIYQTNAPMQAFELGADIERRRDSTNIHSILNHYFSEPEAAALLALPAVEYRERFFDLWTLKESYIKAKGLGLALSLKSFAFDFQSAEKSELKLNKGAVIPLQFNVSLRLINDDKERFEIENQWHCSLGKLNESYRFAISFYSGCVANEPEYNAEVIDWAELIIDSH
ncbi:hypothetical protein BCU91_08770 [Shewanella sp. 10N.286.52.B9]|nr:hypothetical protein BCU91_08770 [Shewanella sp. 10N.286.52.B9]